MSRPWHKFAHPGVGDPAFVVARPATDPVEAKALGLDAWRELPRAQQPPWPDPSVVADVCRVLETVPSVVAPYEVDLLRDKLAQVCEGRSSLRQGGDCAETLADKTESHLLANARTLLPLAVRLTYGPSM